MRPVGVCVEYLKGVIIKRRRKVIYGLVLPLMALIGGQLIIGTPVFAVTDASITINAGNALNVSSYPGTFSSASSSISITTDNYTGYTATLANPNNSTDLVHTSDNNLTIPTITLPQGSSSITSSQFTNGYGFSTNGTNYVPAPTSSSSLALGSRNTAGTSSHTLTLGVTPIASTPSGSYSKSFNIVAIANNPQYSITFNANAGTDTVTGMPSNISTTTSSTGTVTLPNSSPTRSGYTFLGWDTDSTATTPTYPSGSTNTIDLEPTQANAIVLYAIWEAGGTVQITNISYVSGINVSGEPHPSVDNDGNIDFDLTFMGGLDNTDVLQATYRLTVSNTTPSDYAFTAPASNLTLRISANEVRDISYELSGISVGDIIPARSSVSFNIILNTDYVSGEHGTEGGVVVDPVQNVGSLIGNISGSNTGDLSGSNTLAPFQISVQNTFNESKSFTIESIDPDFEVVNSSGNPLSTQTIAAETTSTYTIYLKKASGASFASETATAGIIISYDDKSTNVGQAIITVDKDPAFLDTQAPTISGVTVTKNKTTNGEATVSWTGTDNVGVASYSIYRCTNSGCSNPITGISGATNSYTFTGLSNGTYYFIVVGYDDEGNTATQTEINNSTTSSGHASRTGNTALSWTYTVTSNITNGSMTNTSGNNVTAGGTWQGTISPNNNYTTPTNKSDITVTMDGQPYTDFSYTNGRITINNASGNIVITATCPSDNTCLIEGTLIALADGTTKPIEDISYRDLLKVWNHETGTVGAEYPARIERGNIVRRYQLATLDDGTELKTYGWHGVFDVDAHEFISTDDPSRFYPGVRIYKVENDQLTIATVVSIEIVEEEVGAYHVISSQYYNIIANDVLTTNGYTITSNFYGFEDNAKWPVSRAEFISDPNNLYTYADFADIGIPLRMFNDLRLGEAKYLDIYYGITLQMFKDYLVSNQVIEGMLPYDDE